MEEYEDLENYNGNPTHDMWVDYTRKIYTEDLPDDYDEE